jgi:membrane-bound inhibitor of C-type lysozyme
MDAIVIKTMTLILYMGGDVSEHTAYEQIAKCLKAKRTIERNLYKKTTSVRYSCENKTVEVSKNTDGTNYIVRIID